MSAVNRQQVFISTYPGKSGSPQSSYVTFSFSNTAGFDAWIPIQVNYPAANSAGTEVYVYRSTDGGATYETQGTLGMVFDRVASATAKRDLVLRDPGMYLVSVLAGGSGSAATFSVDFGATIELTTAFVSN